MNDTLKAVIIQVTGGNVRNSDINLGGAFGLFPDDCLGGNNSAASGATIALHIGKELIQTDIDEGKAIFRERGAIRRLFEDEGIVEGDLILIERIEPRAYRVAKASKRGFAYYL